MGVGVCVGVRVGVDVGVAVGGGDVGVAVAVGGANVGVGVGAGGCVAGVGVGVLLIRCAARVVSVVDVDAPDCVGVGVGVVSLKRLAAWTGAVEPRNDTRSRSPTPKLF